ncbi:putative membrane protein [Peptoanaerobacter stomatis]|uniref:Putative membrane protein n=1 Tax=Peptoanaerobacter stomatis TaxID=796937 RepID=J5UMM7_9FIRM|nr:hypothetical protein [Peptoanaerobacter stomatis]EJU23689.1 putative membrane protein [Peptoanaerobacter stomatis]NWO24369.1 hypothetical protein [Peptostreptococcaceae bacterium oral taxon 081]
MDIMLLVGAFCGGVVGTACGAIPSFIITGILALSGGILAMSGINEFSIGHITFGLFWGPHIAFTAGAAAAGFAAIKRKKLSSAQDVLKPLYELNDIPTLIAGGVFAVIGFLFFTLFTTKLSFLKTDAPGAAVFCTLMVCRLLVGKTGPIGMCSLDVKRTWLPNPDLGLLMHAFLGAAFGIVISVVGSAMLASGMPKEQLASFPVICFGISASSLVFLQTGFSIPVTHHITYPAAVAYVLTGNILIAAIVGAVNAVAWQAAGNIFNSNCDTYIDPPATVIMISVSILNLLFG